MKKTSLSAFTFFLLLIFAISCSDDSSPEDTIIKGQVVNIKDNTPISGALISSIPSSNSVLTDSKGNFTLTGLNEREYIINASKYGYYPASVSVNSKSNKTTTIIIQMYDSVAGNHSPNAPILVSPTNNASINALSAQLTWTCSDIDGDNLNYDVYIGEGAQSNSLIYSGEATVAKASNLAHNKTYSWKVVAKDKYGARTESVLSSFKVDTSAASLEGKGLVLYLPLNNSISNLSSETFQISQNEVTFVQDRKGNANSAAYFNGNSYIKVNKHSALDLTDEFTMSCWIKPDLNFDVNPYGTTTSSLMGKWGSTGLRSSAYALQIQTANRTACAATYNGSYISLFNSNSIISANQWMHLAFTFNNGIGQIYINGILDKEQSLNTPELSDYGFYVGHAAISQGLYPFSFQGDMDEVMVFNKALTSDEIKELAK